MICYNTNSDGERIMCSGKCGHIACGDLLDDMAQGEERVSNVQEKDYEKGLGQTVPSLGMQ